MTTTGSVSQSRETETAVAFKPYIFFYGRAEEALDFYKNIFGGTYEIMRVGDSPMKDNPDMGENDRVMHASFTSPLVNFFASDGREDDDVDPDEGNISLALSTTDAKEGERIVSALSEGGSVKMPLSEAFWGGRFANIVDRYGNDWMITTP